MQVGRNSWPNGPIRRLVCCCSSRYYTTSSSSVHSEYVHTYVSQATRWKDDGERASPERWEQPWRTSTRSQLFDWTLANNTIEVNCLSSIPLHLSGQTTWRVIDPLLVCEWEDRFQTKRGKRAICREIHWRGSTTSCLAVTTDFSPKHLVIEENH